MLPDQLSMGEEDFLLKPPGKAALAAAVFGPFGHAYLGWTYAFGTLPVYALYAGATFWVSPPWMAIWLLTAHIIMAGRAFQWLSGKNLDRYSNSRLGRLGSKAPPTLFASEILMDLATLVIAEAGFTQAYQGLSRTGTLSFLAIVFVSIPVLCLSFRWAGDMLVRKVFTAVVDQ